MILFFIYVTYIAAYDSVEVLNPKITLHKTGYFFTDKEITPTDAYLFSKEQTLKTLPKKGYFLGKTFQTYWFIFEISTKTDEKLFLDSKEVFTGNMQDLYVFDSNGTIIQSYKNGQVIPIDQRVVKTYPVRFPLKNTNEHLTYLFKLSSPFPMQAAFALGTMSDVETSWGKTLIIYTITSFILLAFLFYNSMLYVISREKIFLFYTLYIGGFFTVILARWPYLLDFITLSSKALYSIYFISLAIGILGVIYFTIELLHLDRSNRKIKNIIQISYFIVFLNVIHFFVKYDFLNFIWIICGTICVILLMIEGLKSYLNGNKVALYYLFSTGIGTTLMVSSVYLTLYLKVISSNEWSINMPIIALVWDALTLSLLLAYRMKVTENEKNTAKKLIEQKARFTIIGETLGNIAHQWRQPLGELGAINTSIEFSLLLNQDIDKQKLSNSLILSNKILEKLSQTIDTFQGFFNKSVDNNFQITECINEALIFIQGNFEHLNIEVKRDYHTPYIVQGNNDEFFEVLLIVLNNAKDAIRETNPKNPYIKLSIKSQNKHIILLIEDNGGGIKVKNLNTIFEPYQSTKSMNGMGIGLFTAKSIIEERMNGQINAKNTFDGALFEIILNQKTIFST